MTPDPATPAFDLAVIGGGVNGCGIARDAAGRGLSVLLLEQGDLASGTSSASSKLIHGGIRYLEGFDFTLVRESLKERDVILNIAPHVCRPLRFVLPHNPAMRPLWMIRAGLFLYDHLGGHEFPGSRRIRNFRDDDTGRLLRAEYRSAFEYSDCLTDDARLVILTARDAARHGAHILPRTRCVDATSTDGIWTLTGADAGSGRQQRFHARQLINATGPWASSFLAECLAGHVAAELEPPQRARIRTVKGSHLVVRKWFDHERAYILQNHDQRMVFVIPFDDDHVLIGTTDVDVDGDPGEAAISDAEQRYLLDCVHAYFQHRIDERDILASLAGVRPLYDDGAEKAQEASRDAVLRYAETRDGAGLLNVYGGKLTTHRQLAESALQEIARHRRPLPPPWTAKTALPGGEFAPARRRELLNEHIRRYSFVPPRTAARWFGSYGLDTQRMVDAGRGRDGLGHDFGGGLFEAELAWLVEREWARSAEDILWRRSKLGLAARAIDVPALEDWLARHAASAASAAQRVAAS